MERIDNKAIYYMLASAIRDMQGLKRAWHEKETLKIELKSGQQFSIIAMAAEGPSGKQPAEEAGGDKGGATKKPVVRPAKK